MKKYFLTAALAAAPLLAATGAQAITVDPGSQLTFTMSGNYSVEGGGNLGVGSVLNLSNVTVSSISETNPGGIDLDGLTTGSAVTVSGPFTLGDSSNNGVTFSLDGTPSTSFVIDTSFGAEITSPLVGSSTSRLFGTGVLQNDESNDASFAFATSSINPSGSFSLSPTTPPEFERPEPEPDPNVIPLPAAAWMLLAGLGALLAFRRRGNV